MDGDSSARSMDQGANAAIKTFDNNNAIHKSTQQSAPAGVKTQGTGVPVFNKDGAIGSMFKGDGAIGQVGNKVGGPLPQDGMVGYVPSTYSLSDSWPAATPPRVERVSRVKRRGFNQETGEVHENKMMAGMPSGVPMFGHEGYALPITERNMYSQMGPGPVPSGMAMSSGMHMGAVDMGGGIGMVPSGVPHSFYSQPGEHVASEVPMNMAPSGTNTVVTAPLMWDPNIFLNSSDPNIPVDNISTIDPNMLHLHDAMGNMATGIKMKQEPAMHHTTSPMLGFPEFTQSPTLTGMGGISMDSSKRHEGLMMMQRTRSMPQSQSHTWECMPRPERVRSASDTTLPIPNGVTTGHRELEPSPAQRLQSQRPMYNAPTQHPPRQQLQPSPHANNFHHAQLQTNMPYFPQNVDNYQQFSSPSTSSQDNSHFQPQNNCPPFLESSYRSDIYYQGCFESQPMPPNMTVDHPVEQLPTSFANHSQQNRNRPHPRAVARCSPQEQCFDPRAMRLIQAQAANPHPNNYIARQVIPNGHQLPPSSTSSAQDEVAGPISIGEPCQAPKDNLQYWELTSPPSEELMMHHSVLFSAQQCGKHDPVVEPEMEPVEMCPASVDPSLPTIDSIRARRNMHIAGAVTGQMELYQALVVSSIGSF